MRIVGARLTLNVGMAILIATAAPVCAQSLVAPPPEIPVTLLKDIYLECERMAIADVVDGSDAMRCSVIYEELKRRAFDGDFAKIREWTRTQLEYRASCGS